MRLSKGIARLTATGVLLAAIGSSPIASAQSATGKIEVSAVVVSNCRLTISPLLFGEYDPLGVHQAQPLDAVTDLRLLCTRNAGATISLDNGVHAAGAGERRLQNAGDALDYRIFRDASRTQAWGEGSDALVLSSTTGGIEPERITVYGRIPAAQQVLSGAYTDVVTAKVDF